MALYRPPVEALGDMLRIKQQQYLQGFNSVNSNYNLIQNANITDATGQLTAQKEKYIADATRQLKDLSKVDLSLPQNVEAANKVFDPMLNDQAFMMNIRGTQHNDAQIQKLYQWRDSKDEKEREMYDPAALQHLLDDRERLGNAGTDLNKYKEFKFTKAVPFTNIQKFLDEEAVKEKVEIVRDEVKGPYIIKRTNGEATRVNYATWAASKLDNSRFAEQFSILGDVEFNQRLRFASKDPRYAGYQPDQLKAVVREEMRTVVSNTLGENIKEVQAQLALNQAEVQQMGDIDPTATDEPTKRSLARLEELKAMKGQLDNQLVKLNSQKNEVSNQLDRNPEGYFGILARQRTINSWATGKSAIESTEIKKNDTFFSSENLKLDWMKHRLDERADDRDERKFQAELAGGKFNAKNGSGSSDGTDGTDPSDGKGAAVQIGLATNEVQNNGQAWNLYEKDVNNKKDFITENLYNANTGVIRILAKSLGASDEDLMYLGSALSNQERQGSDYTFSKEQTAAANRITPLLETYTGMKITGPETIKQAIFKAAQKFFVDGHNSKALLDPELRPIMDSFNNAHNTYLQVNALRNQEKKMITENVVNRNEYANLVVDRDGVKDMVGRKDITKYFDNLSYMDENGKVKKLTADMKSELADAYMFGKNPFGYNTQSMAGPGGTYQAMDPSRPYAVVGGKRLNIIGDGYNSVHELYKKHGTAEQFKASYEKALNSIVPNMAYFQNKTGQVDVEGIIPFVPGDKNRQEFAVRLLQEFSSTSNVGNLSITSPDGKREPADAATRTKIMNMFTDEDVMEKYFTNPRTIAAQGVVKLTLKPGLSKDMLETYGLTPLVGKEIVIQASENSKGSAINNMKVSNQFHVHGQLLQGKPVESSPLLKDAGFSFKILPDKDSADAKTATIYFTYKKWNPEKKDWDTDLKSKSQPFIIRGEGALSPDVLYEQASQMIFQQWNAGLDASASLSTGPKVSAMKLYSE